MASTESLAAALPYANAALFALQLLLTWFAFASSNVTSQFDTLVTPADYAFSIWNVIYFFTLITVITDVAFPELSIFQYAANPTPLRVCFALSCILNAGWALLFNLAGAIKTAGVDITLLWLVLLPIYLFLSLERDVRPMRWRQYLCSELSIRIYFSWITAATVVSWTITFQDLAGGYLSLAVYLIMLGVLVVSAIVGVIYGKDPVIGLVAVWACIGITQKDIKALPVGEQREKELRIQAAATLAAGVVAVLVLVSALEQLIVTRRYVSLSNAQQQDHHAVPQATPSTSPSVPTAPSTPERVVKSLTAGEATEASDPDESPV